MAQVRCKDTATVRLAIESDAGTDIGEMDKAEEARHAYCGRRRVVLSVGRAMTAVCPLSDEQQLVKPT